MTQKQNLINIRNYLYNQFPADKFFFFITINLPFSAKTYDLYRFITIIRYLLSKFEKRLLGGKESWKRHPYKFYAFCENQFNTTPWHIHLLAPFINPITNTQLSVSFVDWCLDGANKKFIRQYTGDRGADYDIKLVPYSQLRNLIRYCTKELYFDGIVNADRIYTPDILFLKSTNTKKRKRNRIHKMVRKMKTRDDLIAILSKKYPIGCL